MTYSQSRSAVVQATAGVFVAGRRAGSAVLVDDRHLVTARHVLLRVDPQARVKVPVDEVELEFPAMTIQGQPCEVNATRLDLGSGDAVDVAILDLGDQPLAGLPAPVAVWPAARMPDLVAVFGYPLAEGPLNGVWRDFKVAGPTTGAAVQLNWTGDAGSFPGHSGGPVIDAQRHMLVRMLVEGSEEGRFDRFLPVTLIARVWQGLPKRWLMAGAGQTEARDHFTRRARGQRSVARGGDLFRGRQAALTAIQEWLTAEESHGRPLVVTGQPGAGKSSVVARAALALEADQPGSGLAFHARAATITDFVTALADVAGVEHSSSADQLVEAIADLPEQPPLRVVVDALDEAASDLDRRQITETLTELAVLPGLRVAVATRALTAGNPYAPGALLPNLGIASAHSPNLVDLDSETYFDPEGLRQYTTALLTQQGMLRPTPPGAAWEIYRTNPGICDRLANVIAMRAQRNFLVAALAAVPLSNAREVLDPSAHSFDPTAIPSGVGEALDRYFDRLPEHRRIRERTLLIVLAYGRGTGLDDRTWLAFATALGYPATVADLDSLRRSQAADYLLQTTTSERGARPVTRLFHHALTDELLADRHQPSDESQLLDVLLNEATRTGWASAYLCQHAAEHAAVADRLDELLDDPYYLLAAEPTRLLPQLCSAQSSTARATGIVYRQAAHDLTDLDAHVKRQ